MSRRRDLAIDLELAQHAVPPLHWFDLDRRRFLQFIGGGILVCLAAPEGAVLAQESGRARESHELPKDLAAWLHIDKDGKVTVFTGKVEMGQNIRTSLSQQVAEELRVSVDSIRMVMGDTDLCPWDAGTFGSRTTPTMGPQLRAVAATAREELIDLAAERWKVSRDGLTAENGKIVNTSTRQSLSYAELTRGENLVKTLPADAAAASVSPASSWKVAGAPVPKVDGRDFVTGAHRYASDMTRPGMLYGKVLRPVAFEATLLSLDAAKTEMIPGVKVVRDGDFAGIVAPDAYTAERALAALTAEARWKETPGQPSNATLFEYLKRNADAGADRAEPPHVTGSVEQGMASADVKLSQTYTVEYIAHAPLEPARGGRRMEWRQADRLDRHAAPVRRARGARHGISDADRERARDRPRHRLRLRRQAHRRRRGRGRAPGEGRRQAGQGRLDARGGVHLGVLPPRRRDRRDERRAQGRHARRVGVPQLPTPAPPASRRPTTSPTRRSSITPSSRRFARAPIARSPRPRTTSPARATWTSSRTSSGWTRSRSG